VPLQWAATQMGLGSALARLGERENGTAKLADAVAAYRAALEEYKRERVPLQWGEITGHQGIALTLLSERLSDATMARSAVEQIAVAIVILRDGGTAPAAAYYEARLAEARALLEKLTSR